MEDIGDEFEVPIIMEEFDAVVQCDRGDEEIRSLRTVMLLRRSVKYKRAASRQPPAGDGSWSADSR